MKNKPAKNSVLGEENARKGFAATCEAVSLDSGQQLPHLWHHAAKRRWREIVLLAIITLLTYSNTLRDTGFVTDSNFAIVQDQRVHSVTLSNLKAIFSQDYWQVTGGGSGLYRPLTTLSFLFNYAILGNADHAAGYHLLNALVHTANVILVYLTFLALQGTGVLALSAAAIFAVHPVNVEAVTNLVGRADLLATCSVLVGLLCHIRAVGARGRQKIPWLAAMILAVSIGLFCKETAVAILVVVGLYELIYRFRVRHRSWLCNLCLNGWYFFRTSYLALFPPLIIFFVARRQVFAGHNFAEAQFVIFVDNPLLDAGFWAARLTAIKVVGRYLGLLLWPRHLASDYSYNQIPVVAWPFDGWEDWQVLLALVAVGALVWLAVKQRQRHKPLCFAVCLFLGALLPTANLLPRPGEPLFEPESWLIGSIMAERFLYLPSIGFAGGLVVAVTSLAGYVISISGGSTNRRPQAAKVVTVLLVSVLVLALGIRSFQRNFDWQSEFSLWSKDVQTVPNNVKAHMALAMLAAGDTGGNSLGEAISEAEKALVITDRYLPVMLNLGIYYRRQGDTLAEQGTDGVWLLTPQSRLWYEKSVAVLRRAVSLDKALNDERQARMAKPGKDLKLILDDGELGVYENLALAQMRLGNHQEALEAYRSLRHLSPFELKAYLEMAKIYHVRKEFAAAAISLHQVQLLGSNDPEIGAELIEFYRQIDPQGCALDSRQGGGLDVRCPLVQQQICQANFGLVEVLVQAKQFDAAWQMVQASLRDSQCPPGLYDRLMPGKGAGRQSVLSRKGSGP